MMRLNQSSMLRTRICNDFSRRLHCTTNALMDHCVVVSTNHELLESDVPVVQSSTQRITWLCLHRPKSYNALSLNLLQQLESRLQWLDETYPRTRVVILKSSSEVNNTAFCSGHDLKELNELKGDKAAVRKLFETCHRVMALLQSMKPITVAEVGGIATAAGCQLVASCDLAVAAESATFSLSGISHGLACSTPVVPVSRTMMSRKQSLELLLTGDVITAEQALARGLVNRITSKDRLQEVTHLLAQRIASHSSYSTARGKELFYQQLELPEQEARDVAFDYIVDDICHSQDAATGMSAFLNKRRPHWKGK